MHDRDAQKKEAIIGEARMAGLHIRPSDAALEQLQRNRGSLIGSGVLMLLLGIAAVALPVASTFAVEILIGVLLLAAGVFQVVHAFGSNQWGGFFVNALGAVLYGAAGVMLLVWPTAGALSVTLLVAWFFLVAGAIRISQAFQIHPLPGWGWTATRGALQALLGVLILFAWPQAAAWMLGLLVGIDLMFAGASMLAFATAVPRRVTGSRNATGADDESPPYSAAG